MRSCGAPAALLLWPRSVSSRDVSRSSPCRVGHSECSQSGLLRRDPHSARARLWMVWSSRELQAPIRTLAETYPPRAGRRARAGLPGAPALLPDAPIRILGAAAGRADRRRRAHHGAPALYPSQRPLVRPGVSKLRRAHSCAMRCALRYTQPALVSTTHGGLQRGRERSILCVRSGDRTVLQDTAT